MTQFSKQLQQIANDIKEMKEVTLASIDKKLESLPALENEISLCMREITSLRNLVSALEMKIDDLENRSRRNNLIIHGIPKEKNEDPSSLDTIVNGKIISDILKTEPVPIERIHRLGKPATKKVRPVILKLLDHRDKNRVLKNCFKLKGSSFAISEDFSSRVRDVRRKLWNCAKKFKHAGDKVIMNYDKLRINGELLIWDCEKDDIAPVVSSYNADDRPKNSQDDARTLRPRRQNTNQK